MRVEVDELSTIFFSFFKMAENGLKINERGSNEGF
jgi:hypothetical protein